ncbi:MAG: hypothetical protein Q8N91_02245 [Candidatus Omnitrophota bacterium]|nr:hypothetical protein [Candidatus Omnitrophota bacterium]
MKKILAALLICAFFLTFKPLEYVHSEELYREMYASVVVKPTFKLSLDNANINFGYVGPGKSVELYPEKNYNEIKCVSNKGAKWYLRLSVIGDIVAPRGGNVAIDCFKWMITSSTGDGVTERGWHSFTESPAEAYESGPNDMAGEEATIRLKYKLDLPKNSLGGNYGLKVLYTMTEAP